MRKIHFLAVAFVLCYAFTAFALEPPRVFELTDGSIPFSAPSWSPDGKRIAAHANDGLYMIQAKAGATPVRITDIPIANPQWLSDDELIGSRPRKLSSRPPIRRVEIYRIKTSGETRLVYEGWPIRRPFRSSSGAIWYDSAGIVIRGSHTAKPMAATVSQDYHLENHYPNPSRNGHPVYDDTNLWLVSVDGTERRKLCEGHVFYRPKLTGNGRYVVGKTTDQSILVLDLGGNIIAKIDREFSDVRNNLAAWVGHPDLSPDNTLLLFTRGYDDLKENDIFGADIFIFDIRTGQEFRVTNDQTKLHQEPIFSPNGEKAVSRLGGKLLLLEFRD